MGRQAWKVMGGREVRRRRETARLLEDIRPHTAKPIHRS